MTNGRYDTNPTAKADFGNCNSVILRCAQPKCGNGGCTDASIAGPIVEGCVKSNSTCKQYGDDLINMMTAQLVASSNAKIQQQQMALEQARIQAEAQAAAAASQSEQITQMQNQMYQMQQQMAQQQQESAAQLQQALAQQAAQSQQAINDMKVAATNAAKETEAGVSAYEQDAINRGVSTEILERKKVTGQIITEIEDAEVSLKQVKTAMQNSFEYAGCDAHGNNCSGPKRIKKWRELASGFFEPYGNTLDKISNALDTAQNVGVDLSNIYMMLDGSCNSWGQYLCERGADIRYVSSDTGNQGSPYSCILPTDATKKDTKIAALNGCYTDHPNDTKGQMACYRTQGCKPCTLLKKLTVKDEVFEGWIDTGATDEDNGTVVACASNILNNSKLFSYRTKNKNGAGLVDMNILERWLYQTEPSKRTKNITKPEGYCNAKESYNLLEQTVLSRSVDQSATDDKKLCVEKLAVTGENPTEGGYVEDCPYISSLYAICDTHPYNAGITSVPSDTEELEKIKEIVGLKITVVSQQMYKQYEYINATLRRLKTQLEKAVVVSTLEAAGAKSDESANDTRLGGSKSSQYRNCTGKSKQGLLDCLRENYSILASQISSKKCDKNAKEQLQKSVKKLNETIGGQLVCKTGSPKECMDCLDTYDTGLSRLDSIILDEESKRHGYRN